MKRTLTWLVLGAALYGERPLLALVGGTVARDWTMEDIRQFGGKPSLRAGVFPSVVMVGTGCTADVIGRHHIKLAAHCVLDESAAACETKGDERCHALRAEFQPGAPLLLHSRAQWKRLPGRSVAASYTHRLTIIQTLFHHSYSYIDLSQASPQIVGDIAIVITQEPIGIPLKEIDLKADALTQIPIAELSYDPVPLTEVFAVKLGYGCESMDPTKLIQSSHWRLKFDAVAFPVPAVALSKATRYFTSSFNGFIDDFFNVTAGFYFDPQNPLGKSGTLCNGDSGGPLLGMWGEGPEAVVKDIGVNSLSRLYDSKTPKLDEVAIDLHTRIDREGALRLDRWIEAALKVADTPAALAAPLRWPWDFGLFYGYIVPRALPERVETFRLRQDRRLPAQSWQLEIQGLERSSPWEIAGVEITEGETANGPWIALAEAGGSWRAPAGKDLTPTHFRVSFREKAMSEGTPASVCYVSITTPTSVAP